MLSYRSASQRVASQDTSSGHRVCAEPGDRPPKMTSATRLKAVRLTHHYIGVFFSPTILFFAITGGLQMFGLHETSRGSSYVPPAILVHLSQLHKKGTLYLPPRKVVPPAPPRADGPRPEVPKSDASGTQMPPSASQAPNPLPMKIFFAATALALVLSTCTGLFMSWKYARRKVVVAGVLLADCLSYAFASCVETRNDPVKN
jgi:hypothetical protein